MWQNKGMTENARYKNVAQYCRAGNCGKTAMESRTDNLQCWKP